MVDVILRRGRCTAILAYSPQKSRLIEFLTMLPTRGSFWGRMSCASLLKASGAMLCGCRASLVPARLAGTSTIDKELLETQMKPSISAGEHYDRLAEAGHGRDDPPCMRQYMARWDGPPFFDAPADPRGKDILEIGVGDGRIARQLSRSLPPLMPTLGS